MVPSKSLTLLDQRYQNRLKRLSKLVIAHRTTPNSPATRRVASFVCIDALTAWTEFSRAYFLSCIFPGVTRSGSVIGSSLGGLDFDRAIEVVYTNVEPKYKNDYDLIWRKPSLLQEIGTVYSFTNLPNIVRACGLASTPFDDLNIARTFFAHKNGDTWARLRSIHVNYSLPTPQTPADLLFASYDANRPVLYHWLSELSKFSRVLTK